MLHRMALRVLPSLSLAVTALLSRYLGVAGYGQFNYLFAFFYFFLIFNDLQEKISLEESEILEKYSAEETEKKDIQRNVATIIVAGKQKAKINIDFIVFYSAIYCWKKYKTSSNDY